MSDRRGGPVDVDHDRRRDDVVEGWARQELDELVFEESRVPSDALRLEYLRMLSEGVPHYHAAHLCGTTASAFTALRRRDPRFAALAQAAEGYARDEDAASSTIRGALWRVALGHVLSDGVDEHPKAFEALRMLAETHLPEMEHKRTKSVKHGQDSPFEILVGAKVTPEWLASLTDEQLTALERAQEIVEQGKGLRAIDGGAA